MANSVIIDIPGVGQVEAKNAASESTLRELVNAINRLQKTSSPSAKAAGAATTPGGAAAAKSVNAGAGALAKGLGTASKSLGTMAFGAGKAAEKLLHTAGAAASFIKGMSNVEDSLTSAADQFKAIPIAGQALSAVFGAVAAATEKTINAYTKAASSGADFGGRLSEFSKTASQAGLTIDQFGSLVKGGAEGMLAFGTTVDQGAERFSRISKTLRSTSGELFALGFTTQDINEGLVSYGKIVRATGQAGKMTNSELAAGAKNYLKEMDALAKITGEDRKAKEAQAEALAKDGQYQMAISKTGEDVQASFRALMLQVPQEMQGLVKDVVTTGSVTTKENALNMSILGNDVMAELQKFNQKRMRNEALTMEERNRFNNILAKASIAARDRYGESLAANREMDGASRIVTAGLKLQIDSVREATISQEVAKKKTDAINKSTQEMKDRLAQLSNAFTDVLVGSGMLDGLMSGFELISSIVNALVVPAFKILGPVISDIVNIVGFFLTPVFKALGFILNGVADSFVFLRNLIAKPITATLTYLKDLFDRLIKPLDVFGFSFKALSTITDVVGMAFKDLMLNLKEMWYAIKDFIPGLKDATPAEREQLAKERTELSNRRQKIDNMLTNKAEEKIQQSAATARIAAGAGAGMPSTMTQELASKGITDPKAVANIMAQIQAESGFKPQSENLNYSGKKLFEMYGAGNKGGNKVRFKNIEEANAVAAKGPEAVGNVIYGGRMGNAEDEGFKYRGRGMIQLTGKSNYKKYGDMIGVDLVKNPDLANDPVIAQKLAAAYFADKQKAGVNLADINAIGKAVGYAGGPAETAKRAKLAEGFSARMAGSSPTGEQAAVAVTKPPTPAATVPTEKPTSQTASTGKTQESAESLLSSLNTKLSELIAVNRNLNRINERQLSVQQSQSNDLYVAA